MFADGKNFLKQLEITANYILPAVVDKMMSAEGLMMTDSASSRVATER